MPKLNDLTKEITAKVINQNMDYVIEKVSTTVSSSSYKHMEITRILLH